MAAHNELGKKGEELAAVYLVSRGYEILHRNWVYGKREIDIIARKGRFLHFIEVKAKRWSPEGYPEDNVTRTKFRNLLKAADEYLAIHPGNRYIQYDILAITFHKEKEPEFFMLEDVFL
ncbi:MAG: YraN family protein [Chitinophagaceae bacterium]|nr:YraN family protein [Chitinophagaceae bacterium]MBN8668162.1 YraN family protein [Chitinophagales bacterium]